MGKGSAEGVLALAWQRLETSRWLSSCSAGVRASLRQIGRLRRFSKGEYVYRAGDPPGGVFGFVDGQIETLIPTLDGQEVVVHRANSGYWVGDLALFAGQKRLVSLRTITAVTAVQLPNDEIRELMAQQPSLVGDFYRMSHDNVAVTLALLGCLAVRGARNRVALRLLFQQQLFSHSDDWVQIDQNSFAELVSLSTQSVRRAFSELEAAGLIEIAYGKVRIADRDGLAKLCGYTGRFEPYNSVAHASR